MKDIYSRLSILVGPTYTDVSDVLSDFAIDSATITLLNTESMWIGFEKPISSLFFYFTTVSTNARNITVSMYNPTIAAWDVVQSSDDTAGFTRSGFRSEGAHV
jgi:hypothetical protein